MEKEIFKPGNMLYPLPVVMVSCADEFGNNNIITVAWCGTICTNPPMVSVSIRPERHSYSIIEKTKEFVINLTTEELTKATDFCGVRSGRDVNKFKEMNLTPQKGEKVNAPIIEESPVNIECRLKEIVKLGSHDMFIADVVGVQVDKKSINETGKFELNKTRPVVYSHGEYYGLGTLLGNFGYSVRKQKIQKVDEKNSKKPRGKINNEKR